MGVEPGVTTTKRPPAIRALVRLARGAVVVYAAWCAALYFLQDRVLFPVRHVGWPARTPPNFERWTIEPDGVIVEAWMRLGEGRAPESPGPAVIFFHGNGELIDFRTDLADAYARLGVSTLLVEFRGYGRSGGSPSQVALVADAEAFYDRLVQRPEVDPRLVLAHGHSLGGGVAAQLAARRPVGGLVLQCSFTSVVSMSRRYGVPSILVRHPFRTDEALRTVSCPVLVLHGTHDEIVPVRHGRRLAEIRPGTTYREFDGGHNNFPRDPGPYWAAIGALLRRASGEPGT